MPCFKTKSCRIERFQDKGNSGQRLEKMKRHMAQQVLMEINVNIIMRILTWFIGQKHSIDFCPSNNRTFNKNPRLSFKYIEFAIQTFQICPKLCLQCDT